MNFRIITWDIFKYLLKGAQLSVFIAAVSVFFGVILGTLGAAGKMSKNKLLNIIATIYVELFRGTPMMMQITFAFLALPALISKIIGKAIRFKPLLTGIIAIAINSVDRGQFEAADTLGLTNYQKMKMVILPQAFKKILPPLVSEFITLIKDSSLLSTIGVVELMKSATTVGANFYAYLPPLTVASGIYLVLNLIISFFSSKLERRLSASD